MVLISITSINYTYTSPKSIAYLIIIFKDSSFLPRSHSLMRFLKTKIQKAQEAERNRLSLSPTNNTLQPNLTFNDNINNKISQQIHEIPQSQAINHQILAIPNPPLNRRPHRSIQHTHAAPSPKPVSAPTKNIVINYGKAIASFATSSITVYYLQSALQREDIALDDFVSFVDETKGRIAGIASLRSLLLIRREDEPKTVACKKIFRMISEVFIKYFSVNWIMYSKVSHKLVYLKFRSKMLRRVQNPELFTYVKRRGGNGNDGVPY